MNSQNKQNDSAIKRCGDCKVTQIICGYATCPLISSDYSHVTPNQKCRLSKHQLGNWQKFIDESYPPSKKLTDWEYCIHGFAPGGETCWYCKLKPGNGRCTPRVPDPDEKLASLQYTVKCPNFEGVKYRVEGRKFIPIDPSEGMRV
jgi:hypothetical protein